MTARSTAVTRKRPLLPRAPLARAVALGLVAAALGFVPLAHADDGAARPAFTFHLGDCNDSGLGTLRHMLEQPAAWSLQSGDTIDISECDMIDLGSPLVVTLDSLTLDGGAAKTELTTWAFDRLLTHMGTGTLTLANVSLGYGYRTTEPVRGGCVSSLGNVALQSSAAVGCVVARTSGTGAAQGGAIFAQGSVTLSNSIVMGNTVYNEVGGDALGGAIFSVGKTTAEDGTGLFNNLASVESGTTGAARGGGIFSTAGATVSGSTLQDNRAMGRGSNTAGGGLFQASSTSSLQILNSTISGNLADSPIAAGGGGVAVDGATTVVMFSTFADNKASGGVTNGGGLFHQGGRPLSVVGSSFSGNEAVKYGGGIAAHGSWDVTIAASTISENRANSGGGISTESSTRYVTISDSTFYHNFGLNGVGGARLDNGVAQEIHIESSTFAHNRSWRAADKPFKGAGIQLLQDAIVRNSTIVWNDLKVANLGSAQGAGIWLADGVTLTASSSIVADNFSYGLGYANIGGGSGSSVAADYSMLGFVSIPLNEVPGTNVRTETTNLDKLRANGGLTPTALPFANSHALDAGTANGFATDQRGPGFPRVVGFNADMGAVEHDGDRIFADDYESFFPADPSPRPASPADAIEGRDARP